MLNVEFVLNCTVSSFRSNYSSFCCFFFFIQILMGTCSGGISIQGFSDKLNVCAQNKKKDKTWYF